MRLDPIFRLLGTIIYGFIGWELGIALAGTTELNTDSWRIIVPATLVGAAFGFLLTPWLVIAPARRAAQRPAQRAHRRPRGRLRGHGRSACSWRRC